MMMIKCLILEVFQPFAQYRNPFTFYYAQTFPLPPKSTIIGMLQNATGEYYKEDYWGLKISVHGGFESTYWNYQQLIKGETKLARNKKGLFLQNQKLPLYGTGLTSQRSPVNQQELFNGHIFIFIKGEEELINKIKTALEKPKKTLYLGRSEDLMFIKKISDINPIKENEVKNDLWLEYPTYMLNKGFPIKNNKYPVYSIPTKVLFKNNGKLINNKTEISKTTEREPEFKTLVYTGYDYVIHLNKPIIAEKYEIKDSENKKLIFKIPKEYGWL